MSIEKNTRKLPPRGLIIFLILIIALLVALAVMFVMNQVVDRLDPTTSTTQGEATQTAACDDFLQEFPGTPCP